MIFKQDWEKKDRIITLLLEVIQGMLVAAFPNKNLISHEIISGGCANLNIKIQLERDEHPFKKVDGTWKVTGILDWEFSFSGSMLCDVANMLRYAHHMSSQFEEAFLRGLSTGGISLPANWRITVHMLNLLSLLDCLVRSDPEDRPNQCADIRELIIHIIRRLNEAKINRTERIKGMGEVDNED